MGQEVEVFARNGIVIDEWEEADAPARRRRWYDSGGGVLAVLLASALGRRRPDPDARRASRSSGTRSACASAPRAGRPPTEPSAEECAADLGGSADDWARLREAWGERFFERLRMIAERRMSLRVRMLGGTQVGYARMTRRWWLPVQNELDGTGARRRAHVLRQLEHAQPRQHRHRHGARARGAADRVRREPARGRHPARGAGRVPRGPSRGLVGQLPLLRRATVLRHARRGGSPGPARVRGAQRRRRTCPHARRCACPPRSSRCAKLLPDRLDPRLGDVDAEVLAESDAVIVNIDYPLGVAAYNILREVAISTGRAARRLRPRQGGHAERRRRRRDALERRPRRALGLDLLARQRVRRRGPDGRPALRHRARQPARGHRQEHVPPEPRLPRLLLPRGVHGRRDGGGPLLQRALRDRRRRPASRSARPSTSRSSRSTSGSSTTRRTRRTPRRARSARAGSPTTGWTRPTRRRWRSCGGCCGSRARSTRASGRQGCSRGCHAGTARRYWA